MRLREKNRVLGLVSLAVFSVSTVIGVVEALNPDTNASGVIIILMGLVGIFLSFADKILFKIFKFDAPFSILLFLNIFVFLATFPGEIFDAYYKIWWWDMFLHLFSGFGITFIVYEILRIICLENEFYPKNYLLILGSIMVALGGAVLWETIEFSIDSIFNTNMQKFIPAEFLSENAGSVIELDATDEQIVEFYKKPEGYKFALIDTMEDHLSYLCGSLIFAGSQIIYKKVKKS